MRYAGLHGTGGRIRGIRYRAFYGFNFAPRRSNYERSSIKRDIAVSVSQLLYVGQSRVCYHQRHRYVHRVRFRPLTRQILNTIVYHRSTQLNIVFIALLADIQKTIIVRLYNTSHR